MSDPICANCPHLGKCGKIDCPKHLEYDESQSECPARTSERQKDEEIKRLREGLKEAVSLVQQWHDMGERSIGNEGSEAWKIYYDHAPEMKNLRKLLEES